MRNAWIIIALIIFIIPAMALAGDKGAVPVPDQLITSLDQLTPTITPIPDPDDVSIADTGNGGVVSEETRDRIYDLSDVKSQRNAGTKQQDIAIPVKNR